MTMSSPAIFRLLLMAAAVVLLLVAVPATRLFLLFSIPLGVLVAVILHFWNKRPVKPKKDESIKLNLE